MSPKIKRVISTERPGVLQLPRNVPAATAADLGAGAFAELAELGGTLGVLAKSIEDTKHKLELSKLRGDYDAQIADLHDRIQRENADQPFEHGRLFTEGAAEIGSRITGSTTSPLVRDTLQQYINLTLPSAIVTAKTEGLKIATDQNIAELNELAARMSKQAANIEDPTERLEIVAEFFKQADDMAKSGQLKFSAVGKLKRAFKETIIINRMQILARTDRPKLRAEEEAGLFDDANEVDRLKILAFADAEDARMQRLADRQSVQQRFDANREFYKRLNLNEEDENFLTLDDVVNNPFLTRTDREFYKLSLNQTTPILTQPKALLDIVNILMAPTKTREQEVENAETAMQMAKDGMTINRTLSKSDAMAMIQNAQEIIQGTDPEKDAYFKQSVRFLKRKFGWMGGDLFGQFTDTKGAELFDRLLIRLMDDVRRDELRGRAVFDRAEELAKAHAVNWLDGVITGFADPEEDPIMKQLPNPITWRGQKQIIFPDQGRAFQIDDARTKWTPIPVPKEE